MLPLTPVLPQEAQQGVRVRAGEPGRLVHRRPPPRASYLRPGARGMPRWSLRRSQPGRVLALKYQPTRTTGWCPWNAPVVATVAVAAQCLVAQVQARADVRLVKITEEDPVGLQGNWSAG